MNRKQILGSVLVGGVDYIIGCLFIILLGIIGTIVISIVTAVASLISWIASIGWIFGWWFQFQMYYSALSLLMVLSRSNPLFLAIIVIIAIIYGVVLILILKLFRNWFNLRGWYLAIKAATGIGLGVGIGFLVSQIDTMNILLYQAGMWVFWMTPMVVVLALLLFFGIAEGISLVYGYWRR